MSFEIKKDYGVQVNVWGRELLASPSTDSIIRFTHIPFDYLRYVDTERQCITMEFLGQAVLGELVGLGIPDGRQRNSILESEYNEYIAWQATYGMDEFEAEIG